MRISLLIRRQPMYLAVFIAQPVKESADLSSELRTKVNQAVVGN